MVLPRETVCSLVLGVTLGCTQSDRPAAAAVANTSPPAARPQPQAVLVPGFLGCYELTVQGGAVYHVRLTDSSQGPTWVASSYGPGSRNAPGDQWSWQPIDSTRFTLEWGGIDSAMEFTVVREASRYTASGQIRQTPKRPSPTDLHPTVRSVACPPPAA